jgi:hypothetical protein
MTVVPDNVEPGKERCEDCIHLDNLGELADFENANFLKNCFGECICPNSDHYGHIISFGHPACEKKEV